MGAYFLILIYILVLYLVTASNFSFSKSYLKKVYYNYLKYKNKDPYLSDCITLVNSFRFKLYGFTISSIDGKSSYPYATNENKIDSYESYEHLDFIKNSEYRILKQRQNIISSLRKREKRISEVCFFIILDEINNVCNTHKKPHSYIRIYQLLLDEMLNFKIIDNQTAYDMFKLFMLKNFPNKNINEYIFSYKNSFDKTEYYRYL